MSDPSDRRADERAPEAAEPPRSIVDEASEESFPASDSPAWAPPTRIGGPSGGPGKAGGAAGGDTDVGPAVDRALDARMDDRRS